MRGLPINKGDHEGVTSINREDHEGITSINTQYGGNYHENELITIIIEGRGN